MEIPKKQAAEAQKNKFHTPSYGILSVLSLDKYFHFLMSASMVFSSLLIQQTGFWLGPTFFFSICIAFAFQAFFFFSL